MWVTDARPWKSNATLKKLALIIREHGITEGNLRGEELFLDSRYGRAVASVLIFKGGLPGQTLSDIVDYL